jgi:branched-chain amino acid transport system permease protein
MVFGILQLINFAHGEIYMLGAFVGYYTSRYFHLEDHPSFWSLCFAMSTAMVVCALVGYLVERFAYRPLRRSPRINVLITAVGVSLLFQYGGQLIFGAAPKFFPQIVQTSSDFNFGELKINPLQVAVFLLSVVLMLGLHLLIFKTRVGRAMRAVSFNHDYASLMGIPTHRVVSLTFMLGSALAGAVGVLVGVIYPRIDPLMGTLPGLKSFVAAVLGGIGNIHGAVVGAIFLGLAEEFVVAYLAPTYRDALAFSLLIIILLFKPTGLFGVKRTEKV